MKNLFKRLTVLLAVFLVFCIEPTATLAADLPSISYCTHVQNIGWGDYLAQGEMSGTTGMGYRLEGIRIALDNAEFDLGIEYQTHIQNIGWEADTDKGWSITNGFSGTEGLGYRLEAIQIQLTGTDANKFDIYYQVHAQNYGWLDWAKNGESAGTEGFGYRLEGIRIKITPVGTAAPGSEKYPFVSAIDFLNKIKGDWYNYKLSTSLASLKIKGNPYEESGLIWMGSKYYECRYQIIWVAQDCNSGTFEAYEQNYYKPPNSGNPNWEKIPISINDTYYLNNDNTILRVSESFSETYVRKY